MKILNTEVFIEQLKKVISDAVGTKKITSTLDTKNDKESNGSLYFVVILKKDKNEKKIGLYIFERKNGITTFIVNGETLELLFENATINSPQISLTYLKSIIESDIKWLEDTKPPKKKNNPRNKFSKNTGGFSKNKNNRRPPNKTGGYKGEQKENRYDKNGRPTPKSNDSSRYKKKTNNVNGYKKVKVVTNTSFTPHKYNSNSRYNKEDAAR